MFKLNLTDYDHFLSEEDLDLQNMSKEELYAYWNAWLLQAQSTNQQDKHLYSHGVFLVEPGYNLDGTKIKTNS
jgi:hypothetical protein